MFSPPRPPFVRCRMARGGTAATYPALIGEPCCGHSVVFPAVPLCKRCMLYAGIRPNLQKAAAHKARRPHELFITSVSARVILFHWVGLDLSNCTSLFASDLRLLSSHHRLYLLPLAHDET